MTKKYTELSKEEEQRAIDVHQKSIVINALSNFRQGSDPIDNFQKYCDIMKKGCVSVVNLTVASEQNLGEACSVISKWYNLLGVTDDVILILSAKNIREAKRSEKTGIILGFQNTSPLDIIASNNENIRYRSRGQLELFYNLGVRIIQLTYNRRALTGDGCFERTDCGLSRSGIDVVEGMNKLGILIDLSHCGQKTTLEAIETSEEPVAFTHSGTRTLNDLPRLKGDEEIKALAEKGGVMGIIAESNFVRHEGGLKASRATLEDMLDHIDYVRDLVGIDHVGIGGDIPEVARGPGGLNALRRIAQRSFEEVGSDKVKYPDYWYFTNTYFERMWVKGFETMAETLNVTKGLVARGYSDQEIMKVQGGNFLKLFERVWGK
jgi:membrane dipeptidase